jgi:hypothetical protein
MNEFFIKEKVGQSGKKRKLKQPTTKVQKKKSAILNFHTG